jgi:hypothetical protein
VGLIVEFPRRKFSAGALKSVFARCNAFAFSISSGESAQSVDLKSKNIKKTVRPLTLKLRAADAYRISREVPCEFPTFVFIDPKRCKNFAKRPFLPNFCVRFKF